MRYRTYQTCERSIKREAPSTGTNTAETLFAGTWLNGRLFVEVTPWRERTSELVVWVRLQGAGAASPRFLARSKSLPFAAISSRRIPIARLFPDLSLIRCMHRITPVYCPFLSLNFIPRGQMTGSAGWLGGPRCHGTHLHTSRLARRLFYSMCIRIFSLSARASNMCRS